MLALFFFRVPQPRMLGLFLPSEKQAKGEPKHSPEREQAPCACAWPHTKALQSLVRVKKCELTKPCVSIQLPFRMGGQLCLQRQASGALCNLQLMEGSLTAMAFQQRTPASPNTRSQSAHSRHSFHPAFRDLFTIFTDPRSVSPCVCS